MPRVPLVPMLFALSTQPLVAFLQYERTQGRMLNIKIEDSFYVCKQMFANDLGILTPTSETSFKEVNDSLLLYEWSSRAKLNLKKSIVILIYWSLHHSFLATIQGLYDFTYMQYHPIPRSSTWHKYTLVQNTRVLPWTSLQKNFLIGWKIYFLYRKTHANLPSPIPHPHLSSHVCPFSQRP